MKKLMIVGLAMLSLNSFASVNVGRATMVDGNVAVAVCAAQEIGAPRIKAINCARSKAREVCRAYGFSSYTNGSLNVECTRIGHGYGRLCAATQTYSCEN